MWSREGSRWHDTCGAWKLPLLGCRGLFQLQGGSDVYKKGQSKWQKKKNSFAQGILDESK